MTTKPKKAKAPSSKDELSPEFKKLLNPKDGTTLKTIGVLPSGRFVKESFLHDLYGRSTGSTMGSISQSDELLNDYTYVGTDAENLLKRDQPFPMAIRAMKWQNNACYVLLEQSPSMRTIFWSPTTAESVDEGTVTPYSLPFPWTQFLVRFQVGYNVYEDEQTLVNKKKKPRPRNMNPPTIKAISLEDVKFSTHSLVPSFRSSVQLYRAPLPNSYSHGSMCFGYTYMNGENPSLVEAIEKFVEEFYSTTFNTDLSLEFDLFADTKFEPGENRFATLFDQWSKCDLVDMVDPGKIPFASLSSEKNFWENHHVFSPYCSDLHRINKVGPNGIDLSGCTLSSYDSNAKREKVLLKDYPEATSILETFESIEVAVKSIFNKTPRIPFSGGRSYAEGRRFINQVEKKKTGEEIEEEPTNVFRFTSLSGGKMEISKETSRTVHRPKDFKDLATDLGAQPPYKMVLDQTKLKESIAMLRRELQTGPLPLPPGLRFWCPSNHVLVFERPPAMKTVAFLGVNKETASNDSSERESYKIFVPWTQYWVNYNTKLAIQSVYATCSSVPMSHKDWVAGVLPLPNMYYESKVCTPNVIAPSSSIGEIMLSAYNSVWGSNYNMDLLDGVNLFIENCSVKYSNHGVGFKDSPEGQLAQHLWKGHRKGNLPGFLQAWSEFPNPHELLKVIPSCPPRNRFVNHEDVDFECECDASNPDYEDDDLECICHQNEDHAGIPVGMNAMIMAAMQESHGGWLKGKLRTLDGSIFSAYDGLLLHAQAHEKKMTY